MKQLHVILSFLLMVNLCTCQGQTISHLTEEQQLRKQMDDWMRTYYREEKPAFDIWVTQMEDFEISALKHPIYKRMNDFYREHQEQYLRLRKADLARYKPAPKLLPGYKRIPTFQSTYNDPDSKMKQEFEVLQKVANFRTLTVADTRIATAVLTGFIIQHLVTQQGMDQEEITLKFAYAEIPFADPIQENQWKITFINRMYALRFNWNIENNQCTDPEVWVYTGGQQPAGWLNNSFPKANTPVQQLEHELNAFRWALYDQADSTNVGYTRCIEDMQNKLTVFYQSHRKTYIKLRNGELTQYSQIDEVYAKAFQEDVPGLKADFLAMLIKKENLYQLSRSDAPYEIDGARMLFNFYYLCMMHSGHVNHYNMAPWVGGRDVHTKKLTEDLWEIQAFYQQYMLRFQWNVATDEISNIIVRTSDTNTVPEDTKEIMVKPAESNP